MILTDAWFQKIDTKDKDPAQVAIEHIDAFRGESGTLLVSQRVFDYISICAPAVFDFAESKGVKILEFPC